MTFNRFKVLTFDIVGTLIDFETGILNAFREIGEKASEHLTDDQIFAPYVEARTKYIGRYTDIMHDVYLHVARDLKLPETEAAAKHFQASILAWPAFKDSCDALKRLRQRYRLVAMTNSDRVHYSSYAQTLGDPFHDSVTLDEGRFAKPDHRFFFYTLGRLSASGYKQDEILHVAQSQYHDMGVGRELGYAICWIERRMGKQGFGGHPHPGTVTKPDYHFGTVRELADAIERE